MILINSYSRDSLNIFNPFIRNYPPISIASLVMAARREGIKAYFVDEQIEDNVLGLVDKYVKEIEQPYIFGFSVLTFACKNAIVVSRKIKKLYPNSFIVFGGIHPTACPDEILSFDHIDAVIRGKGEKPLIDLYKCIKSKRGFSHLDNLSYKKDGHIQHNKLSSNSNDSSANSLFPYHLFSPKKYNLAFVLSAVGCPHKCIFCSSSIINGSKYKFRPPEVIIDELKIIFNQYHNRFVYFLDDDFLANKERVYSILELLRREGLNNKMSFFFTARADNYDRNILKELYVSGFKCLYFGIETSNEKIMKRIKKGESVAKCIEAVLAAKRIGFLVAITFLYGLPGETHRDRLNCLKLSKDLDIDMVRFNNAIPYPGTELYMIAKQEKSLNIQGLYENFNPVNVVVESPFKKTPLPYIPKDNSEEEIRRDILLSYLLYYINIKNFIRAFTIHKKLNLLNNSEGFTDFLKNMHLFVWLMFKIFIKFSKIIFTFKLWHGLKQENEKSQSNK